MAMIVNSHGFGPPPWTPATLGSTLQAWYDADSQSESDTATVLTVVDRTANGHNGTAASPIVTLRYNVLNGRKVFRGATGTTQQNHKVTTGLMASKTAGTYLCVLKASADPQASADNSAHVISGFGSQTFGTPTRPLGNHYPYTDSNIYEAFGTNSRVNFNPTPSLTSWRIYCARAVSGTYTVWFDGVQEYNRASNTVSFNHGVNSNERYLFWSDNDTGNEFHFVGDCAEILICDSGLSTTDRQKAEGYLAHRWGLTANLDVSHPYKSTPPT